MEYQYLATSNLRKQFLLEQQQQRQARLHQQRQRWLRRCTIFGLTGSIILTGLILLQSPSQSSTGQSRPSTGVAGESISRQSPPTPTNLPVSDNQLSTMLSSNPEFNLVPSQTPLSKTPRQSQASHSRNPSPTIDSSLVTTLMAPLIDPAVQSVQPAQETIITPISSFIQPTPTLDPPLPFSTPTQPSLQANVVIKPKKINLNANQSLAECHGTIRTLLGDLSVDGKITNAHCSLTVGDTASLLSGTIDLRSLTGQTITLTL